MSGNIRLRQDALEVIIILVLTVLILATGWRLQYYDYIDYDDAEYVSENYKIQSGINAKSLSDIFTDTHTGHWHPLTMLSHMIDWQLFGDNAGGHHWTNVIIHIFNTILLFLLFRTMTGALWRSAFVAALFAIHPINVESVAWIAERKNVLSTFFWLLTMLCYVWYVKFPDWKRYLPLFICFALGLMSKAMLVTLPFVLLLMDYWPLNRTTIRNQQDSSNILVPVKKTKISFLILEKIPLFILTAVSIGITFYAAKSVATIESIDSLPLIKRIANVIFSYAAYLKKLFWPTDLAIFYPYWSIPIWQVIISAFLLITLTIILCKYFRKYPYLIVGWFWYLGTLVPVIGLVQVGSQSMADRYAYVPFIGLFVMIAWLCVELMARWKRPVKIILYSSGVAMIIFFAGLNFVQVSYWQNSISLSNHALTISPNNFFAFNMLGLAAQNKNDYEGALYYYYRAVKINPHYYQAYNNAGVILQKLGRIDDAIICFKRTININKYSGEAFYNLGILFIQKNNPKEAFSNLHKAKELMPNNDIIFGGLGYAFLNTGNYEEAIVNFKKALHLNPRNNVVRKNMERALAKHKEGARTISE